MEMFDAHVNTAVIATQDYLKSIGKDYSFEQAAALFRNAAYVWSDETVLEGYDEWLEEQADRAEYDRMVEM
jgi:hypothetical protein